MSLNVQRLVSLLLFTQSLFVASTFGSWMVTMLVAIAALVIAHFRGHSAEARGAAGLAQSDAVSDAAAGTAPKSQWTRYFLPMLLTLAFIGISVVTGRWRVSSQLGENLNLIYVGIDTVAHIALFVSLLVYVLSPRQGHVALLPLGMLLILLCVAGGGTSLSSVAQTTVGLAAALGFALASQAIVGSRLGTGGTLLVHDTRRGNQTKWLGPLISMLTLTVLLMATSAIASATGQVLPSIRDRMADSLDATFGAVAEQSGIGGTRYVRGSTIGSLRRHMLAQPDEVALRAYCSVAPGYLRGSTFDLYRSSQRRWFLASQMGFDRRGRYEIPRAATVSPRGQGETELVSPVDPPLNRFQLSSRQTSDPTITVEVHNDPLKGQVVFLPLATRWIEAASEELTVTKDRVIRFGVDVRRPYVAGAAATPAVETLTTERRGQLLHVPAAVAVQVRQIVSEVCSPTASARENADAISQYFQNGFTYSLSTPKARPGADPIAKFLESRHGAHCEYFASATVLALRGAGIPARYVTGYVLDEYDSESEQWLARNRDAHAWAEAYDEQSGQWFPVESTPGRVYQTVDHGADAQTAASMAADAARFGADDDATLFGRALGWLLSFRITDPLFVVFRILQLPVFVLLLLILWFKYLKPARQGPDPTDLQSRKMLRKVDRRLKRFQLVRRRGETLDQFAARIERFCDQASPQDGQRNLVRLRATADWYRDFARARYQGQVPHPLSA